jgi:DNA polymerase-3 subunit gamma/tau
MTGQLALKHRPRFFGDVAGQRATVALLYLMCKRGTVPAGLLFSGERGCGKTTLARITARALNCEAEPGPVKSWPCGTCPGCVAVDNDASPDVEEIDAASNGTVDQIRQVRERALYGSVGGRHKVYIIDEAHGLSGAAFDTLLKILEEPPPGVVFILTTTQPRTLPKTIHSRCSPFRFTPLPVSVIRDRLAYICEQEGLSAEPALLAAIAEAARGGMRDAVVRLDQVTSVGISSLAMWQEMTGETDFAPVLLAAAADGAAAAMYAVMDEALSAFGDPSQVVSELVFCLRDLQVLSCGADIAAQGEALAARRALADRLGPARVHSAMAVLWDLQVKVHAVDRLTALTLALSVVSRRLCPQKEAVPIAAGRGEPASLSQLKSILGSP